MPAPALVKITGNTYPVRDQLKALGGKWSAAGNCWLVPGDRAEEAERIVASAGPKQQRCGGVRRAGKCATCGCRINYGVYCGKCEYS